MTKELILNFGGIKYVSSTDEELFFAWLKKNPSIIDIKGKGTDLLVACKEKISDVDLKELLAVSYRYRLDMSQLKVFMTDKNKHWFCDRENYWYIHVFQKEKGQNNV